MARRSAEYAELIDKVMADVDPIVAAAGLLCAGSTALGVMPPLTAMVNAFSGAEVQSDIMDALTWSPVSQGIGWAFGEEGITSWSDIFTGHLGPVQESDKVKARRHTGMIFLGMFEGMLLMSVARNESILAKVAELGGKLGSATITAAGEAVPF